LDLASWADRWIKTAGLNELALEFETGPQNAIKKFVIHQSASLQEFPTLREHTIDVHFVNNRGRVFQKKTISIEPEESTAFTNFSRIKNAECVVLNACDYGYCKVVLDERSLAFMKKNLGFLGEELTRALIWRSMWDMVRDAKMSGVELIEIVLTHLASETKPAIVQAVLKCAQNALESYIPDHPRKLELYHQLFELILQRMREAETAEEGAMYKT
jgi:aminopeptidase N